MEFLTEGLTLNSDRNCVTLRSLKQRIHGIRLGRNICLLHRGNAKPHCSAQKQDVMEKLKFTVVLQPPYSPDLTPSEFWLFLKFKETLKNQHCLTDAEVQAAPAQMDTQPTRIFLHGRNEEMHRVTEQMCSC
ncbi:hypothetical protein TNCV_2709051 [Trichonephila clavipes]|nr:hypothetical protein TNCV_2709051 [Trichonephila clavipes]